MSRDRHGAWGLDTAGVRQPDWRDNALCRRLVAAGHIHPDTWYPAEQGTEKPEVKKAKRLCAGCPVWAECRAWAFTHDEQGIWGGLTERERNALRKRRGRGAEAVA